MFRDWILRLVYRRRIEGLQMLGLEAAWPLMAKVLSHGSVVTYGRVGAAGMRTYSAELLDAAIEERETAERLFAAAAVGGNATLAANALQALERLQSDRLPEVAAALAQRTEVLHCRSGCFGEYRTLAELAGEAAERYRESAARHVAAAQVAL